MDISMCQCILTIICLYGPSSDDPNFFDYLFSNLSNFHFEFLITDDGFNFFFNTAMDNLGGTLGTNFKIRDKCLEFMYIFDLVDIWRGRNPNQKYFTWKFNITQDIYYRLGFFLISLSLGQSSSSCTFVSDLYSDHTVVNLDFNFFSMRKEDRVLGSLGTSLLTDRGCVSMIKILIIQ